MRSQKYNQIDLFTRVLFLQSPWKVADVKLKLLKVNWIFTLQKQRKTKLIVTSVAKVHDS